ncbi:complement C1q tumor necrosis factor-related protein 5 [Bombina bombina]|uniref:complement C1q tumor necrosis factor-related protein 5 n=1 Tax=Bombina bombina TaxID=8345 RepID=UPI00235A8D70|nr:complement C1q tumor necrosis factor-related protein 5 [Bombina bombina]
MAPSNKESDGVEFGHWKIIETNEVLMYSRSHREEELILLGISLIFHTLLQLALILLSCQLEDNQITPSCCSAPGIPGVPGTHGNVGIPGRDGRDGRDGAAGANGSKGDTGDPGAAGVQGFPGSTGTPGLRGERGPQGECAVTPRSAFSAKLSGSRSPPIPGQPVPFGKVLANEQGHYKPETGRFRCVVPGLYYFSLHGTVYRGSLHLQLMKNGHPQASFFQSGDTAKPGGLCGGIALHLEPDDEVWVQLGDYPGLYASEGTDSVFTGFLIYSDWDPHPVFSPLTPPDP